MKDPGINTKVVHSQSKPAWNVVGTKLACKYKIARCPYPICKDKEVTEKEREEALNLAKYISFCFNNSKSILKHLDNAR